MADELSNASSDSDSDSKGKPNKRLCLEVPQPSDEDAGSEDAGSAEEASDEEASDEDAGSEEASDEDAGSEEASDEEASDEDAGSEDAGSEGGSDDELSGEESSTDESSGYESSTDESSTICVYYNVVKSLPLDLPLNLVDEAIKLFSHFVQLFDADRWAKFKRKFDHNHFHTGIGVLFDRVAAITTSTPKEYLDFLARALKPLFALFRLKVWEKSDTFCARYQAAQLRLLILHSHAVLCLYTRAWRVIGQEYNCKELKELCSAEMLRRNEQEIKDAFVNGVLFIDFVNNRWRQRKWLTRALIVSLADNSTEFLCDDNEGTVNGRIVYPPTKETVAKVLKWYYKHDFERDIDREFHAHALTLPFRPSRDQSDVFLAFFHKWISESVDYDANYLFVEHIWAVVVALDYFARAIALDDRRVASSQWLELLVRLYHAFMWEDEGDDDDGLRAFGEHWCALMVRVRATAPEAAFRLAMALVPSNNGYLRTFECGVARRNTGDLATAIDEQYVRDLAEEINSSYDAVTLSGGRVVFVLNLEEAPTVVDNRTEAAAVGRVIASLYAQTVRAAQQRDIFVRRVRAAHWAREARLGDAAMQRRFAALVRDASRLRTF